MNSTMNGRRVDDHHVSSVINEVMSEIGLPYNLSIAQRAQRCADALIATEDQEAIRWMLVEGWERQLSRQFTAAKRAARNAAKSLIKSGKSFADGNGLLIQQLALPIIVPGRPPVPLASAWHTLLLAALDAEETQMRGRQINIDLLRRAARVTQRWPERTVADLLRDNLVSMEELFGEAVG